jgi:hypothetical protein
VEGKGAAGGLRGTKTAKRSTRACGHSGIRQRAVGREAEVVSTKESGDGPGKDKTRVERVDPRERVTLPLRDSHRSGVTNHLLCHFTISVMLINLLKFCGLYLLPSGISSPFLYLTPESEALQIFPTQTSHLACIKSPCPPSPSLCLSVGV